MRKLKLQVQMSVDGFVGGPKGELDWMTWDMDEDLLKYINELTDSVGTILMGRKMTDGFVSYWTDVVENKPDSLEFDFAKKMVNKPKIVFTKTLDNSIWANTFLAKGDLVNEVNKLKKQKGKDIIVYGGASFVSSLIKNNLIDEYNLFINQTAIGKGLTIFGGLENNFKLKFLNSTAYKSGIVVNVYEPKEEARILN
jgi:dihydrofolate reductase